MAGRAVRVSGHFFLILAKPNQEVHPRLGVIVAKKAYRLATKRNRVKRIIRESFRQQLMTLPAIDVVALAHKGKILPENSELFQDLETLWKDLNKKFAKRSSA